MGLIETPKITPMSLGKTTSTTISPVDPPVEELAQQLVIDIETYIETNYYLLGTYPKVEEVVAKFNLGPKAIRKVIPRINSILDNRGLAQYDPDKDRRERGDIDPMFAMAVNLMVDITDKRSKTIKLKTFGKTPRWWEQMLEEPQHRAYFDLRVDKIFKGVAQQAKLSLSKNVELGDLPSIKYYHEVSGIHDPQRDVIQNLNTIIQLLMEILIKRLDPKVVAEISREFDTKILEVSGS